MQAPAAARQANEIRKKGLPLPGPSQLHLAWSTKIGPTPIGEIPRSETYIEQMNGRIGALAIQPEHRGVHPGRAPRAASGCSIGQPAWVAEDGSTAVAGDRRAGIAPSDDDIVYAGTGEGALSGDSYFGNGILKSTDGGHTWSHVSGDYFVGVAISRLLVDPNEPTTCTCRCSAAAAARERTSPPCHSKFGIWESNNGGIQLDAARGGSKNTNGATDLEMDPQNPQNLYTSFWGDAIYKSTDGGDHWTPTMKGSPTDFNAENLTRFSIGISHPAERSRSCTSALTSSTPRAIPAVAPVASTTRLRAGRAADRFSGSDDSVLDYCGGQCFYDNVMEVDPTNTDIVYAGGQFDYDIGSGGTTAPMTAARRGRTSAATSIRTTMRSPSAPIRTWSLIGSDGGVWWSRDRGGRLPGALDEGGPQRRRPGPPINARWPSDRPVHQHRHQPQLPGRSACGAVPRTTARCASRPSATRGSTCAAVTAARCSSTRTTGTYRLRHVLRRRPYRGQDWWCDLLRQPVHPQGPQPERPLGLLHAVGHEQ